MGWVQCLSSEFRKTSFRWTLGGKFRALDDESKRKAIFRYAGFVSDGLFQSSETFTYEDYFMPENYAFNMGGVMSGVMVKSGKEDTGTLVYPVIKPVYPSANYLQTALHKEIWLVWQGTLPFLCSYGGLPESSRHDWWVPYSTSFYVYTGLGTLFFVLITLFVANICYRRRCGPKIRKDSSIAASDTANVRVVMNNDR